MKSVLTIMAIVAISAVVILFAEQGGNDARARSSGAGNSCPQPGSSAVWAGLVLATNESDPKDVPGLLAPFASEMRQLFGYNQFEILKKRSRVLNPWEEDWFVPHENLYLGVTSKPAGEGMFLLDLELYRKDHLLLETSARLSPGAPLMIRGPEMGRGQLILVIFSDAASVVEPAPAAGP